MYEKIPPNKLDVIGFSICTILMAVLTLCGVTYQGPHAPHPLGLFLIFLCGLCVQTRSIIITGEGICFHYHIVFFKYRIPWERVKCIEFVYQHGYHRLYIVLDDCLAFSESNLSPRKYEQKHPFKVIRVSVPDEKKEKYYNMFKKFSTNTRLTNVNYN